jgi:hypothetical protein
MSCTKTCRTRRLLPALLLLVLPLLAPGVRAQTTYKIQPIVKFGDTVGDVTIKDPGDFEFGALNDRGQLAFVTENADRPTNSPYEEVLIQYGEGRLTPIVAAGKDAPGGKWPHHLGLTPPVSMNQLGNIVFAAGVVMGGQVEASTFLWDAQAQTVTAVALAGMPAGNNLSFVVGGGWTPTINNRNEIALVASVQNAAAQALPGVFFRDPGGTLLPVALPDQALPGGGQLERAFTPSLNDAGLVGFLAHRRGDGTHRDSAYLWERGAITPVAVVGTDTPGLGKIGGVWRVLVNNANQTLLVVARGGDNRGPDTLYRFADGKLTPLVVPGQEMPGGGKFKTLQGDLDDPAGQVAPGVSAANEAGRHAFLAMLESGATAAYLLDADGKVSLILKSGTTTDLGQVTNVGRGADSIGVGLNTKGQVALTVKIAGVKQDTLVLLTPTSP